MKHVAERGYARATLRDIASDAGLTNGTLFYYFPTKADLVTSTFTEVAEPVIDEFRSAATREDSFVDALTVWLDGAGKVMKTYPHLASFFTALGIAGDEHPELRQLHRRAIDAQREVIFALVSANRRTGQFRPDVDSAAIADLLSAVILGLSDLASWANPKRHRAAMEAAVFLIDGTLIVQRPRG